MALTFDTKEPRDWNETEADDAPDPEKVASNVVETDGCDHDNNELLRLLASSLVIPNTFRSLRSRAND